MITNFEEWWGAKISWKGSNYCTLKREKKALAAAGSSQEIGGRKQKEMLVSEERVETREGVSA